jgi:apoptotic protease-activating factor
MYETLVYEYLGACALFQVFDGKTGAHLSSLKGHRDCIRSCRFAKNGLLASGDDEGYIRIWDPDNKGEKKLRTLVKHNAWVTDIKWSDDSKTLVSVSDNVKWWNHDGCVLQTLHIRGSFLKRIWTSDDFKTFVTIDSAGTLYILKEI